MFIGSCAVRQIAYHDCTGCTPSHRLHTDTTRGCRQSDSLSIRLRTTGFARETPDRKLSVLERRFVGNGQFLATFRTTCSQHLATVGGSHSRAESVLVDSLATRRLISSLHCHNYLVFIVSSFSIGCMSLSEKGTCGVQRYNDFLILQKNCEIFRQLSIFLHNGIPNPHNNAGSDISPCLRRGFGGGSNL